MGETEADQLLRRQLETVEARRRQERGAAGERAGREEARLAQEALERDRDAAALIPVLLEVLKRLEYAGMEPVVIQREHRAGVRGKRKIRNLPTVVKAGWRIGEHHHYDSWTPEYGRPVHNTVTLPVYLLSDGRVVAAPNYEVRPDGTVAGLQPDVPGTPDPVRWGRPSWYVPLEDGADAFLVPVGRYLERLRDWHEELTKPPIPPDTPPPPADHVEAEGLAYENMYEQVREAYERTAVDAGRARQEEERRNAEERTRQQREAKLRRYASRFASALASRDGQRAADSSRRWVVHEETDGHAIPLADYPRYGADPSWYGTVLSPRVYQYELGENGELYLNGALVEGLTHATMNQIERGLANLAVWYRLDPELFRTDDR